VSESPAPDLPPPPPADLRRRATLVIAAFVVVDVLLVLGLWGDSFGLTGTVRSILLGAALLGGLLVVLIGMDPFRRHELRFAANAEPEVVHGYQVAGFVLLPLVLCVPVWKYLAGEPWRTSASRAAAIAIYLGIVFVLARWQRRGVAPYLRPAWYGYFLAGITAGLAWSVLAGQEPAEGIAHGVSAPLLHYAYVRWAMRGTGRTASDAGPPAPA
jgi:GNAT superfamily N-acetyltransferase